MTSVTVHIESEPHTQNLDAVLLTRPVPTGGAFLINARIDRPIWDQMKTVGAWYVDQDYLDDMDMFDAEPGWRYSLDAVAVLLRYGFELQLRGETVTTVEQLRGMFTTEAKEAYRERVRLAREAAERAEQERREAASREREAKGVAYAQWQEEHLAGLVQLSSVRTDTIDWTPAAHFEAGTPGAWYDTGDRWEVGTVDGETVYRCFYGNALKLYAPPVIADRWYRAAWEDRMDGSADYKTPGQAALWALGRVADGAVCYGDDLARWAVEHIGEQALIEQAMAEAPVRSDGTSDALASKIYRIPVRERVYSLELATQTNHRPGEGYLYPVGYGSYTRRRPNYAVGYVVPAERQASDDREMRLYGWIELGQEEIGSWPTAEDIAEIQQRSAESAARFSALFAG